MDVSGQRLKGTGVSAGVVIGKALLIGSPTPTVQEIHLDEDEVEQEVERFQEALRMSRGQIEALRRRVHDVLGRDSASIFDSHLLLVDDPTVVGQVVEGIRKQRRNAEYVFESVIRHYREALKQVDDSYIRDRLVDIQDVAGRIICNLHGHKVADLSHLTEPCIVVAQDLSPSDTAGIDRQHVRAFITAIGSRTSHTAIMARAMGIPAVVGLSEHIQAIADDQTLIVDGSRGEVVINPTPEQLRVYERRTREQADWLARVQVDASLPAETLDGFHVRMAGNIELPDEVESLRLMQGIGIGLFRTEFLFIRSDGLCDEEEHFHTYRQVAEAIYPCSVIFRTLDIGGDKFLSHLKMPVELNPFLGMRAIRFCLHRMDIFRVQLRAILRASAFGKVRILFPMISTLEEMQQALAVLADVKEELTAQGIDYNPHLDVGIMVEVPAAAMLADKLAPHVDFISLGTNDLVQYSLAVDRSNPDISYLYQPTHPAIIRMIQHVVQAVYTHGKWIGICGEMAAEPLYAPLILGLGIHELSMAPVAIPEVKRVVRHIRMHEAEALVDQAVTCGTAEEVTTLCRNFLRKNYPEALPAEDP
ncbi:MAG: phosphoenolpyruvate--protein phosphotransferase [Lentisphaeria bacterium]|nr:phosphoenolpyruvate--protein phosphotransferase [Lentisphaeria bacterium]